MANGIRLQEVRQMGKGGREKKKKKEPEKGKRPLSLKNESAASQRSRTRRP